MKIVLASYAGKKRFFDMHIPDPGLAQLCGVLSEYGLIPKVFDLNLPENTVPRFLSFLRVEKPDLIGFKFFDTGFRGIIRLAELIKKEHPNCCIVAAGPHVTLFREHIYHQTNVFDFLVVGEGEIAVIDLIEYLTGKRQRSEISNTIFLADGNIVKNETQLVDDLDTLALPNWQLLNLERYFPLILLNDHRGCPNTCAFCAHNYLWGYEKIDIPTGLSYRPLIRKKTLKRLWEETTYLIKNFGVRLFGFTDSTPLRSRLKEWAKLLMDSGEKVFWTSFANVNQFSFNDFQLFSQSGCKSIWIGVETGDEGLLRKMNKNYSRSDILQTFSDIGNNGIVGVPGFIIGFPGETIKSVKETLSLIEELKTDIFVISPFILDPGTLIAINPEQYGISLSTDWECKIILRDELNEFEIPYYTVNGQFNNIIWADFAKITPYKGWDADRTIAESEYAAVLAAALNIPISEFVRWVTESLSSPNPDEIYKVIQKVWQATS